MMNIIIVKIKMIMMISFISMMISFIAMHCIGILMIMIFSSGLGQAGGEGEGLRGFLPGDINRLVPK